MRAAKGKSKKVTQIDKLHANRLPGIESTATREAKKRVTINYSQSKSNQ